MQITREQLDRARDAAQGSNQTAASLFLYLAGPAHHRMAQDAPAEYVAVVRDILAKVERQWKRWDADTLPVLEHIELANAGLHEPCTIRGMVEATAHGAVGRELEYILNAESSLDEKGVDPDVCQWLLDSFRGRGTCAEALDAQITAEWANAVRMLPSEVATARPPAETQDETINSYVPEYVTISRVAAYMKLSSTTLRNWINNDQGAPKPQVEGGGGSAHQFDWQELRPWLEKRTNRILPPVFPGNQP